MWMGRCSGVCGVRTCMCGECGRVLCVCYCVTCVYIHVYMVVYLWVWCILCVCEVCVYLCNVCVVFMSVHCMVCVMFGVIYVCCVYLCRVCVFDACGVYTHVSVPMCFCVSGMWAECGVCGMCTCVWSNIPKDLQFIKKIT